MLGTAEVHRHVAGPGWQVDGLELQPGLDAWGRPYQSSVRAGHDAQHAGIGVRTSQRDADGERATLVGVTAQAAVLVPGDIGDTIHHTDRLAERAGSDAPRATRHVADPRDASDPLPTRVHETAKLRALNHKIPSKTKHPE